MILKKGCTIVTTYENKKNISGYIDSDLLDNLRLNIPTCERVYSYDVKLIDGTVINCDRRFINVVEENNLPDNYHLPYKEQNKLILEKLNDFDKKEINLKVLFYDHGRFSLRIFKGIRFFVARSILNYKRNNFFKYTKIIY